MSPEMRDSANFTPLKVNNRDRPLNESEDMFFNKRNNDYGRNSGRA